MSNVNSYPVSNTNKVKRVPKRAVYDKEVIHNILDSAFVCHVSFIIDDQPFIIPTAYGRSGELVYIHGAATSRMLSHLRGEIPVCVAVTQLDGIVLARSTFHSSMNYRSAIIFGKAHLIDSAEEKIQALKRITDNIIKNRWQETRQPNEKELKATSVLAIKIETASAKIRTGGPLDDPEDMDLDIWAGVIPLTIHAGLPIRDELLKKEVPLASSVVNYSYA